MTLDCHRRWELLAKQVTAERDEKIKEVQAAEAAHFAETQARRLIALDCH